MIGLDAYCQQFSDGGVVRIPALLATDELAELERELARYVREIVPGVPAGDAFFERPGDVATLKQLQRMHEHDGYFAALQSSDKLTSLADALLGTPSHCVGVEWFNKPAGEGRRTPPHQDGFYFCLEPDEALTMWIAMDRADETNGCLRYVRGSHLAGIRDHGTSEVLGFSQTILDFGPSDLQREFIGIAQPGDALVHHSATIHWAEANGSDRSRRSLALVFHSDRARRDETKFARYLESSRQQQRTHGVNV